MAVNGVRESQVQCFSWHDPVQGCDNNMDPCDNRTVGLNNDPMALEAVEWIQDPQPVYETDGVNLMSESPRQPSPDLRCSSHEDNVEPEKEQSLTDVILSADEECDQLIPTRLESSPKPTTENVKVTKNKMENRIFKGFAEEKGFERNLNEHRKSPVYDNGNSEKPLVIPSIRDRIAALRCAAHLADLDLTPVRDTSTTRGFHNSLSESSASRDNCVDGNTSCRHSLTGDDSLTAREDKEIEEHKTGVSPDAHDTAVQDVLNSLDSAQSTIDSILNQLSVDPGSGTVSITTDKGQFDIEKSLEGRTQAESGIVVADKTQKDIIVSSEGQKDIIVRAEAQKDIIVRAEVQKDIVVRAEAQEDIVVPAEAQKDITVPVEIQKDTNVTSEAEKYNSSYEAQKNMIVSSEAQGVINEPAEAQRDIPSSEAQRNVVLAKTKPNIWVSRSPFGLRRRSSSPRLTGDKRVDTGPSGKDTSYETGFSTGMTEGATWNGKEDKISNCEEVQPNILDSPRDQGEGLIFSSESNGQHPEREFHQTGRETEDKSPHYSAVEQKRSTAFDIDFSDISPKRRLAKKPSLSRVKNCYRDRNGSQDQSPDYRSANLTSQLELENQSSSCLAQPDLTLKTIQFYGESEQEVSKKRQTESVAFEVSLGNQPPKQRLKPKLSSDGRKPKVENVVECDSEMQVGSLQQESSPEEIIGCIVESKQPELNKKYTNSAAFEVTFGSETPKQHLKPKLSSSNRKLVDESVAKFDSECQIDKIERHSSPEESIGCTAENEQSELNKKQTNSVVFEISFGNQQSKQLLKPKLSSGSKKPPTEIVAKVDSETQVRRLQQYSSPERNVDQDPVADEPFTSQECVGGATGITFDIDFREDLTKRRLKPTLSSSRKNEKETDNEETLICEDSRPGISNQVSVPLEERTARDSAPRPRRGTYGLESVSQSLQSASDKGIPVVDALDHIVKTIELAQELRTTNTSRGTYSLDSVADSLQVSSEKGVDVTESLRNLAQMEETRSSCSNVQSKRGQSDSEESPVRANDSSETSLVELPDSLTVIKKSEGDQNLAVPRTESPVRNRGTYTLDTVSHSLEAGQKKGLSHVDVLHDLASKQETATASLSATGSPNTDTCVTMSLFIDNSSTSTLRSSPIPTVPSPNTQEKAISSVHSTGHRSTYTLDEVEQSLQSASDRGIPFVGALDRLAGEKPQGLTSNSSSAGNRGTYTLDDVSGFLEAAKHKGIPVVDVLKGLTQADPPQTIASVDKPGNRSTYTLDEVAQTLESAKEKGLPMVLALDLVSNDQEAVLRDGNAKLRRVEKLKNRKTYALASPLETVSEGQKMWLFDGTQRRLVPASSSPPPPIPKPPRPSLERRLSAEQKSLTSSQKTEKKGLPLLQKLDFLTSACEVMLESSAKSLEANRVSVSSGNDGAAVDPTCLLVSKERARRRVLRRLAVTQAAGVEIGLQMKPELQVEPTTKDIANRSTYSLERVALSLEGAQTAGLPIIDVLDKMSSDEAVERSQLAETPSVLCGETTSGRNKPSQIFNKDQTIQEGVAAYNAAKRQRPMSASVTDSLQVKPLKHRNYSLDDVAFALETSQELGVPFTSILNEITVEQPMEHSSSKLEQVNDILLTAPQAVGDRKRGTYSLDEVSKSLDEASKDLPIVEALKGIAVDASREIRKSVNLAEDMEQTASELNVPSTEGGNRGTVTLDSVGTSLDGAKARGLPVIEALEELIKAVDTIRRRSRKSMEILEDTFDQQRLPLEDETAVKVSTKEDATDTGNSSGVLAGSDLSADYSLSADKTETKRGTYSLTDVSHALDLAQESGSSVQSALRDITGDTAPVSHDRRGTYDLDEVGVSLDTAKDKGLPVITALDKILQAVESEKESIGKFGNGSENHTVQSSVPSDEYSPEPDENRNILNTAEHLRAEKPEIKPRRTKRIPFKKPKVTVDPGSFYIELFPGAEAKPSQFHVTGTEVRETTGKKDLVLRPKEGKENIVDCTKFESNKPEAAVSPVRTDQAEGSGHETDVPLCKSKKKNSDKVEIKQVDDDSVNRPQIREKPLGSPRTRATWRPSATVLDKISSLLDTAENCGLTLTDVLDHVADVSEEKGEIEEGAGEEENQAASSQLALLHMQLEEKRRHIEAEKLRNQVQQEEERRRLGQTAFWYVLGKARREPGHEELSERPQPEGKGGNMVEVLVSDKNEQPSPPIGHSSPKTSPRDRQQMEGNAGVPEYETREFRLSEFPPQGHIFEGHYQGAFPVGAEVPGNIRPKRERTPTPPQVPLVEPGTPPRKCWTLNPTTPSTPPPFAPPSMGEANRQKQDQAFEPVENRIGVAEVEVDEASPKRGGMALFIGEDANVGSQGLTPEQQKKRDRFLQSRLKKQEEEKARKEAELEKKRRREEKHREKEMQKKQEEERRRWEEKERQKIERERLERAHADRERLTQEPDLAAGYATYRARPGVRSRGLPDRVELEPVSQYHQPYMDEEEAFAAYGRPQSNAQSGFAEFSGPQCYVKPSGKSNRKIMINAVSHVCLCGVPNKEAKEKCLQAINESPVQNFIALFRDGLKFRGLYSYIPDADQITKIYGIGPRVVTVKMIENVFKYNSGGKEFVKIPSTKTLSIQVDGITIQKGFWQTSKPAVQSKTMSNLKRPPPRTHR